MFETSVVRARVAQRSRVGVLTISVIAHTAVIFGAVAVSVASVEFPAAAPDEYRVAPIFATVQIPPPLGNPNGGGRPQSPPASKPQTPPPANQVTAPSIVPDEVMPVDASPNASTGGDANGSDAPGLVPGPVGVPWGDPNSVANDLNLPAVPEPVQVEEKIYEAHEVKAPVLLRKVEPRYPQSMIRVGVNAVVIVRCIIDKNGNVRDPQVVSSALPPFNQAVINAVEQWKFTPGSLRGQAVETYLTLTVRFDLKR